MNYEELDSRQKCHVNGVLSKFMDVYIRNNLIWTPEQMCVAFLEKIKDEHESGNYGVLHYENGKYTEPYRIGSEWLESEEAKTYILSKFTAKYNKNKKLARKDSPLIERLRFGIRWEDSKFFDINYGLKNGSDFEKTDIVENLTLIPWSIEHVENELKDKYIIDLKYVLDLLCESPIEKIFYERWMERFYIDKRNPALIPELCGTRNMYYCYKDLSGRYSFEYSNKAKSVNVRFDFCVINYKKQKMLLIELDGHDYHKTKDQRINDSIKRSIATQNGWQLNVITGTQIHQNIDGVFDMMEDYFTF